MRRMRVFGCKTSARLKDLSQKGERDWTGEVNEWGNHVNGARATGKANRDLRIAIAVATAVSPAVHFVHHSVRRSVSVFVKEVVLAVLTIFPLVSSLERPCVFVCLVKCACVSRSLALSDSLTLSLSLTNTHRE